MIHKVVFVVGDRFETFRQRKDNVLLYSEYVDGLIERRARETAATFYVPSQGLSAREVSVVLATASHQNRSFLDLVGAVPTEMSRSTHKHMKSNIIITTPVKVTDDLYGAKLHLDDDCAEMSDHVTGCHLQGMLLIEAARQLFIAVTETFYLGPDESGSKYFVINSFDVKFKAFAFPLPTDLAYQVKSVEQKGRSTRFVAEIDIVQAGTSVCGVAVDFGVFESVPLTDKELQKSTLAVEREVSRLTASFAQELRA